MLRSNPHPVISILTPSKGKKLIPRIFRHVSEQQILLFFTLLIATFSSLDVVRSAALLDSSYVLNKASTHLLETVKALETETDLFLGVIIPIFINTLGKLPLRIVAGMLGLFCDRNDIVRVAQSKPGLAFLTIFLSRAEVLKQSAEAAQSGSEVPVPDAQELQQWYVIFPDVMHDEKLTFRLNTGRKSIIYSLTDYKAIFPRYSRRLAPLPVFHLVPRHTYCLLEKAFEPILTFRINQFGPSWQRWQ